VIALWWQFLWLFIGTLAVFGVLSGAMSLLTRVIGEERLKRWVGGSAFTAPGQGTRVRGHHALLQLGRRAC